MSDRRETQVDTPSDTPIAPAAEPERALTAPAAPLPAAPGERRLTMAHRPVPAPRRRPRPLKWVAIALAMAGALIAITLAWMPQPVAVELEPAVTGPLEVTVDEDGRTRVKDRYVVSAPLAGTLSRIELRAGDSVRRGDVVARVLPLASPLLDRRSRAEAEARVAATEAAARQAATAVTRARAAHEFARREAERQRVLLRNGATAGQAVEEAELTERMRGEEAASAAFGLRVAESESRIARAALLRFDRPAAERAEQFEIRAPVDGRVLRIVQESEGAVQPGSPLLEIGDPRALEVVVDVLTADAVDIARGTAVRVERWGGDSALRGHVHHVEPSAFTRISSLGIEEQRVNIVVDLDEPWERWAALGDGYRVEAHVIVWRANEVLQIPAGAVFRSGDGWAAYVADAGRARLRSLGIGRRNAAKAQVVRGLRAGERVIVYPGDDITDGVRIETR